MIFKPTILKGVYLITLDKKRDDRGFFARTFCRETFRSMSLAEHMPQTNTAYNTRKGTLRGMNYQEGEAGEDKLIRCISGCVQDVIIDMRSDSDTYGQHLSVTLSPEDSTQLYIPKGFAHGYLTLAPDTEILYQVSQTYHPSKERGIRWDDPFFNIKWSLQEPFIMSEKDRSYLDFQPDQKISSSQ